MHPIFVGSGRVVLAAGLAVLFLLFMGGKLPSVRQFYRLFVASLGVAFAFPVLVAWAMITVPAAHGGILLGILPMVTSICGVIVARERPSALFWVTAVLGAFLVILYALLRGEEKFMLHLGDLLLVVAVIAAGIGYGLGAQLTKQLGGVRVTCWLVIVALPINLPLSWIFRPEEPFALSGGVWAAFFYLALVSQFFGFFFWYRALAMGGIARISQVQLLQPFMTLGASAILLNERADLVGILFAVLIVATVFVNRRASVGYAGIGNADPAKP